MVAGELGRAAVFQDDCVDDVAAETGHAPPPSCWSALCPATWVNYVVRSHTSEGTNCPVSGHRGHLLQDIVHRPASAEWLVIASRVESQGAEELSALGDDADVGASD